MTKHHATGKVVRAFGNLLHVAFEGNIRQGEVAMVELGNASLKAEVIEIVGNEAKLQVYEDTRGVKLGTHVEFSTLLLEAELGPGLLSSIFDGLQNPLENVAKATGLFLTRGTYLPALDYIRHWDYNPIVKVDDVLSRGEYLGYTMEGRFHHYIMVPFVLTGKFRITWVIKPGSYTIDTVVAKAVDEQGAEHEFTMVQKWPVKICAVCWDESAIKADDGHRLPHYRYPISGDERGHILRSRTIWSRKNGPAASPFQIFFGRHRDRRRLR